MLITFEGLDGAGKTYHSERMYKKLVEIYGDKKVILTREPIAVHKCFEPTINMLFSKEYEMDSHTELLLFLALRREHFIKFIAPALKQDYIVICDRFTDSTIAYQGYGYDISIPEINRLNAFVTGGRVPDITFILDGGIHTVHRQPNPNKYEQMDRVFLYRVLQGFRAIGKADPRRCHIINIDNIQDDTFMSIFRNKAHQYRL